jgi:hypothetical protein
MEKYIVVKLQLLNLNILFILLIQCGQKSLRNSIENEFIHMEDQ